MAKISKPKHNTNSNPRSRASKRQTSPSIDIDKSLRTAPRASDASPFLGSTRPNENKITKSKKKQKPLKRGQRARHERDLARAEAVQDQMEKKVATANSRLKKTRERKVLWDEINESTKDEHRKTPKFAVLSQSIEVNGDDNEDDWEDENGNGDEIEMKEVEGVLVPASAPATKLVVVDRSASLTRSDIGDEFDKIT